MSHQTVWWYLKLSVLFYIVGGLLVWLLRPAAIPPADQMRSAAAVIGFLLLMAAMAGVASMATVQFWKLLFQPRGSFHAVELESLFGPRVDQVLGMAAPVLHDPPSTPPPSDTKTLDELLDNPTEIVMGQLRSAADYIILRPAGFENALRRLAGDAGKSAVEAYLAQRVKSGGPNEVSNDAVAAVRFFVEQHLNWVHVVLKERWRRRVRLVAVAVAGSTGLLTIVLADLGPMAKVSALFGAVIWGGFFSWLARDVVALVERRRG